MSQGAHPHLSADQRVSYSLANIDLQIDEAEERKDCRDASSMGVEESLESHEVIELQAFIERKAWIEEKIKLLEQLPSVDAFAYTDRIPLGQQIDCLITREKLQEWVAEHDRIEKETEVFNSGDLKKLKKFTRAATQKNLSSEDTDLIELTLTTLYSLDKLLHLLRDRSENFDLMSLRLTWEEHRLAARQEREKIIEEMEQYFSSRARWSPTMYNIQKSETGATSSVRRGSVASAASDSSSLSLSGISRSLRFKLAEVLSRDAAQYSTQIINLKHNRITAAAKVLDKLIDNSRFPVPELILDEQDTIENICGAELEGVGQFALNVVMQWKKADEVYVETKKDQMTAHMLIEEIEVAKLQHPTAKQDALFISRAETLSKRLSLRPKPSSSSSFFPKPLHALFPAQAAANETIIQILTSELTEAYELNRKIETLVNDYHEACKTLKASEDVIEEMTSLRLTLALLTAKLEYGFSNIDSDGSVPELSSPSCLNPIHHSAYLTVLPSLAQEVESATDDARAAFQRSKTILSLRRAGITDNLVDTIALRADELQTQIARTSEVKRVMLERATLLRAMRRRWMIATDCRRDVAEILDKVKQTAGKQRWFCQSVRRGAPMTPESPSGSFDLCPDATPNEMTVRLDQLHDQYAQAFMDHISSTHRGLSPALIAHFKSFSIGFEDLLLDAYEAISIWANIKDQSAAMTTLRSEAHSLSCQLDDLHLRLDSILTSSLQEMEDDAMQQKATTLSKDLCTLRHEIDDWVSTISTRIPLVSSHTFRKTGNGLEPLKASQYLTFDLGTLDAEVRTDCNAYALQMSGAVQRLLDKQALIALRTNILAVQRSISSLACEVKAGLPGLSDEEVWTRPIWKALEENPRQTSADPIVDVVAFTSQVPDVQSRISGIRQELHDLGVRIRTLGDAHGHHFVELESKALDNVASQLSDCMLTAEKNKYTCFNTLYPDSGRDHIAPSPPKESMEEPACFCEESDVKLSSSLVDAADVFSPSSSHVILGPENNYLGRVRSLKCRLQSLDIRSLAESSGHTDLSSNLPSHKQIEDITAALAAISWEIEELRSLSPIDELQPLITEADRNKQFLEHLAALAMFSSSVTLCDRGLSDLLDHIDSFPSTPIGQKPPSGSHFMDTTLPPEEQFKGRLEYTRDLMDNLQTSFSAVADDLRAFAEHARVEQTWNELHEMAMDRLHGTLSRPGSKVSQSSLFSTPDTPRSVKRSGYSQLSLRGRGRGNPATGRPPSRAISTTIRAQTQLLHAPDNHAKRSLSGPSVARPTFASRQRTNSVTSNTSSVITPFSGRTTRQSLRVPSPSVSEYSGQTRRGISSRSVSNPQGTWERGSRKSIVATKALVTTNGKKRAYVANPKSRLDIAVGDVVNRLPVDINVEVVADTWKDQSGKYWIGDTDPKLCFCRILRSRTVMVRVGGGWSELSKFIKEHYADLFRMLPEATYPGTLEERWISSSALLEAKESPFSSAYRPQAPRTPEPRADHVPIVAVHTPEGKSPNSIRSQSSPVSPLTPLQFLRRADETPMTPLKLGTSRVRRSIPNTPTNRLSIWRP